MADVDDNQTDQEEQFPDDIDLLADWQMQDRLIAMAKTEGENAWEVLSKEYDPEYLNEQLNETAHVILQRIFNRCRAIMPKEPLSSPPNHLADLMQVLFYRDPSPQKELLKQRIMPAIKAVRWLRAKRTELLLPKMLEKLQNTYNTYFNDNPKYIEVKFYGRLARDMLRALPSIEWPNEQFTQDIQEGFGLSKQNEEDGDQFVLRASDVLYYYQLLCHLLVAAQKFAGSADDAQIDLKTALTLAPPILKSLLIRDDLMLKYLVLPDEALESLATREAETAKINGVNVTETATAPTPAPTAKKIDQENLLDVG